jgi:hypothetical protein
MRTRTVLNGGSSLTESARLRKQLEGCVNYIPRQGNPQSCCAVYPQSAQAPITPAESTRILAKAVESSGVAYNGVGVTQDRVRQLLAAQATTKNYVSEGVKTDRLIQKTIECTDSTPFTKPILIEQCPPLPAPPAPPMRACMLPRYAQFR